MLNNMADKKCYDNFRTPSFHSTQLQKRQRQVITNVPHVLNIQTAVTSAVEHLHELSTRMSLASTDIFNTFKEDDVAKIDKLITAIKELEAERLRIREVYETETIKSSKLRFKLFHFPDTAEKEAEAAIASARESNAEIMKRLSDQLAGNNAVIEEYEKKCKNLEAENTVLLPERENVRQKHEEIISLLNQRMADKAASQITLNETRDKVRQANESILSLEDGIIQLKDELIEERKSARSEKKGLKQNIADTVSAIKEQNSINVKHKQVLDDLRVTFAEWYSKVEELKKIVHILTQSYNRLTTIKNNMTSRLEMLKQENEFIKKKGDDLDEDDRREDESFASKKAKNEKRLAELEIDIEKLTGKKDRLQSELDKLKQEYAAKQRELDELVELLNARKLGIKAMKDELMSKSDKVSQLQLDNVDLDTRIEESQSKHNAVIAAINKTIEESREKLNKERTERVALQSWRADISRGLDDFKHNTEVFMSKVNSKILTGKVEHKQLTDEGARLQATLLEGEDTIKNLKEELKQVTDHWQEREAEIQKVERSLQEEIEKMQEIVEKKKKELQIKEPEFEKFHDDYQINVDAYSDIKRDIAELKNHQNRLLCEISTFKSDKANLERPTEELRRLLKADRNLSLHKMEQHMTETRELESRICETGSKLKKVIQENYKFTQGNDKLQSQVSQTEEETEKVRHRIADMFDEYNALRQQLLDGWKQDQELEEKTAVRDNKIMQEFGDVMSEAGKRVEHIDSITNKLEAEISMLAAFLEKVTRQRPPVTPLDDSNSQKDQPHYPETDLILVPLNKTP